MRSATQRQISTNCDYHVVKGWHRGDFSLSIPLNLLWVSWVPGMYLTVCPLRVSGYDSSAGEWMYLTVCPLRVSGYDSSTGEWMYLTVCPLRVSGNDSSAGELMYLTVCPLHGPGNDSSVGGWMYLTVCRLRGPSSIPWLITYAVLYTVWREP